MKFILSKVTKKKEDMFKFDKNTGQLTEEDVHNVMEKFGKTVVGFFLEAILLFGISLGALHLMGVDFTDVFKRLTEL